MYTAFRLQSKGGENRRNIANFCRSGQVASRKVQPKGGGRPAEVWYLTGAVAPADAQASLDAVTRAENADLDDPDLAGSGQEADAALAI